MELLAPSGSLEQGMASIINGCDSLYGGFKLWNTRNKAKNLTIDEYNNLLKICKKKNIKFYLTLNTLLTDDEITEIINILKNNTLPDAVIVYDLGLLVRLKNEFPALKIHISTQFGAHCTEDIKLLEYLAVDRVILPRELTLNEVKNLKEFANIELEVFVWGSQCISFSGLCYFSLVSGGSGNRGKCIAMCRDMYQINEKKGQLLYARDLDATAMVNELAKYVDCCKIEGRRRNINEIADVIKKIKNGSNKNDIESASYLPGKIPVDNFTSFTNSRIKPKYLLNKFNKLSNDDRIVNFKDDKPQYFVNPNDIRSTNTPENNFYVYSEKVFPVDHNRLNVWVEIICDKPGIIKKIYCINDNGEGKLFDFNSINSVNKSSIGELYEIMNNTAKDINIYKLRYIRTEDNVFMYNNDDLTSFLNYLTRMKKIKVAENNPFASITLKNRLTVETDNIKVLSKLVDYDLNSIIFSINTTCDYELLRDVIANYDNRIIYKLPIFNYQNYDMHRFYSLLENKNIIYTRLSQVHESQNYKFKSKMADYTLNCWNKEVVKWLESLNIHKFTASPELSFADNMSLFGSMPLEVIFAGQIPLLYTRHCFKNIIKCNSCTGEMKKTITNTDKNLEFSLLCYKDHRRLINKDPILINLNKDLERYENLTFRYIASYQNAEDVITSIENMLKENYYNKLIATKAWMNSYPGNFFSTRR